MFMVMMMLMLILQNAPMLLVKDIGVGGMAFMKMLQETQMYSNYCSHLKQTASNSQQSPYNLKTQMPDKKDSLSLQTSFTSTTTADLIRALPSSQKRSTAPWKSQIIDFIDEGVEEFDAATELFTIATIGTIEMKASALQSAVDAYERLYGPRDQSIIDETLKKYTSDLSALEKKHVLDPHSHSGAKSESLDAFIRKIDPESSNNKMFNENLFTTELYESEVGSRKLTDEYQLQDSERPLTWCNGLVCGGYSNTPYCTSICMDLWERKMKLVRKQTVFKSIVKKHHHSNLVMLDRVITIKNSDLEKVSNTRNIVGWKGVDGREAKSVKINLQPRLDVVRHRKETQSQFEKRREIVGNRRVEILCETEGTTKQNQNQFHSSSAAAAAAKKKKRRTADIYGPGVKASSSSQKRRSHVLYARASSADSATWTIAQYYSGRDKRSYRSREIKALKVLKPLMLRFISRFRKYKFIESILLIQAHIRGFLVRNNIPVLVELLINRKIDRLLACIRIRNFIRFHEVSIWRKRVLRSKEMQLQRTGHRMTIALKLRSATDYNNSRTDYAADASPRSIDSDHSSVKSSSSTEAIATPIVIPHTTVKPTTDIHAQLRIRDFLQYGVVSKVNTSSNTKSMSIVRRASMERDIRLRTINEDDTASEASSPSSAVTSAINNNFVSVVSEDTEVALNLAAAFSFDSDDGRNYGGSIKNAYSHSHTSGTSLEPVVDSDDETSSILALTRTKSLDLDRPVVSIRSDNASIDRRGSSDSGTTSARKVVTQSLLMDGSVNDEHNDDGSSIVSSKSYHSKDMMAPAHLLENHSKKFSPIGRFVAENSVNVNMKNVTTSATAASRSEIIKHKESSASIDSDSLVIIAVPTEDSRKPLQRRRSGMWAPTKLSYDSSPKRSSLSSYDMLSSRSTDSSDNNNNKSPPSLIGDIGIVITKDKVESSSCKQEKTSPVLEQILEEVGTISNQRKPGAADASFKYVRADGSLEILHANDLSNIPYEVLPTYVLNLDDDSDEQSSDETIGLFSDDDLDDNTSMPDDLLVLLTQAPLRAMGPSVMDLLNRQEVGR